MHFRTLEFTCFLDYGELILLKISGNCTILIHFRNRNSKYSSTMVNYLFCISIHRSSSKLLFSILSILEGEGEGEGEGERESDMLNDLIGVVSW